MIYVFFQYWIFIALALVLGLFVGWATCTGHDHNQRSNWLAWAVAAFLAGLFLAGFKWIPGLLGHLLEVALMLFAAYIIGCITGCGARSVAGGDDGGGGHGHGHDDGHGAGHGHGRGDAGGHGSGVHASAAQSASATAVGASAPAVDASPATGAESAAAAAHAPPAGAESPPSAMAEAATSPPASVSSPEVATAAGEAAASPAVSSGAASSAASASASTSEVKASAEAAPAAPSAAASPDVSTPPRGTMTDGRRSILAAKEKLALQRQKAAAAPAPSTAETVQPASAPPPVAPRAALVDAAALAPRAAMTDGQRSILAARQKMAEKAAKAAAVWEAEGVSTPPAPASAATGDDDGARPGADSDPAALADDLKLIKGVGPQNEAALNGLGVRRFAQIADWSADNEKWVGQSIKFPGRIERENWVAQAKLLAAGIETPHAAAVKSGAIKIDESADTPLSDEEAKAFAASLPQQAPKVEGEHAHAGARPLGLAAPKGGGADDLKRIKGIGRQNEERLHNLGVWHFDQIAAWSVENVKWVGSYLAFPGRIDREQWIAQAASLARGELTEFAKRVDAGEVPTSSKDGRETRLI
ncbi:MAG: cell envelope biogenesis protein TolA [Rhodoblastus sp.]|nr:cell envelope biogenesis protein TolA [Rhodoblastus sp.]